MGVLKAKVDGEWVEVGGAAVPDVLWTGPEAPTDPTIELWIDTDEPAYVPSPYTPLDQSTWAWTNQGSATVTQGGGVVLIESPTGAAVNLRIRSTTAPPAPYTITAIIIPWFPNVDGQLIGIGVREVASGELMLVQARKTGGRVHIDVRKYNSPTSENTQVAATPDFVEIQTPVYLQFEDTNTDLIWRYSFDGVNFIQLFSEARTTFLTPNQIAFAMNVNGGQIARASIMSWVQT